MTAPLLKCIKDPKGRKLLYELETKLTQQEMSNDNRRTELQTK